MAMKRLIMAILVDEDQDPETWADNFTHYIHNTTNGQEGHEDILHELPDTINHIQLIGVYEEPEKTSER